jgi:hypothetical protein
MARGGKREGAGRPSGARNTVGADLREAAREYTPEALETLRSICKSAASESARVAAASAILDRAYGKPAATVHAVGDVTHRQAAPLGEPLSETVSWLEQLLAKGEQTEREKETT